MPSNQLKQPNRATQSVVRDIMMPKWLIRPKTLEIPLSTRRDIAALANVNEKAIKRQLDEGIAPLVSGANAEGDALNLANDFGLTGIEFEVIKAQSGLSAPALLFASALISAPLFLFTKWYFGVIPIITALGWLMVKGASSNQRNWNTLHGQYQQDKRLLKTLQTIQSARIAILKADMSPIITQELTESLDKLEDKLDGLTRSGKLPDESELNEISEASKALEEAAIHHQNIDINAAENAKIKANLLKNTSQQLGCGISDSAER